MIEYINTLLLFLLNIYILRIISNSFYPLQKQEKKQKKYSKIFELFVLDVFLQSQDSKRNIISFKPSLSSKLMESFIDTNQVNTLMINQQFCSIISSSSDDNGNVNVTLNEKYELENHLTGLIQVGLVWL